MKAPQSLKIACLLCAVMMLPAVVQAQDYTYTTNNGTITITRYTGSGGDVTIPSEINGLPVVDFGQIFYQNASLTRVTIGTNVTSIGNSAFGDCTSLTSVTIPNSVANIGYGVFYDCFGLTSVMIGNGVTNIGDYVFYQCLSLTSVTIGSGVSRIGDHAFSGCTSLTGITVDASNADYSTLNGILFDKSQTTIVKYPVCTVGSYVIPNSVTSIGVGAFAECVQLTSVTIGTNVTCIGAEAFFFCSGLNNVTIPNSVTNIGNYAFCDCWGLIGVMIGNGVKSIGDDAFYACTGLTGVTIPNSVTGIGDCPFGDCYSLMAISVDTNNPVYSSLDGVLFNHNRTTLIQCPGAKAGSYTVPDSVTSIGYGAFYVCWSLTGVYFQGNAPTPSDDSSVFYGANNVVVYYLPGMSGWTSIFDGRPTASWLLAYPLILNNGLGFGVRSTGFGFTISWATNLSVVVEACTNLANSNWYPVATNTLNSGTNYFSDPDWTNYLGRFYRIRSP